MLSQSSPAHAHLPQSIQVTVEGDQTQADSQWFVLPYSCLPPSRPTLLPAGPAFCHGASIWEEDLIYICDHAVR